MFKIGIKIKKMISCITRSHRNMFFRNNNYFKYLFNQNGNIIRIDKSSNLYNCNFTILGGGNLIVVEQGCNLCGLNIFMEGDNNIIVIGKNSTVNASRKSETHFNACNGRSIIIGSSCLFSNGIELHTTDYHTIFDENLNPSNNPADIIIGDHCWVGLKSVILKGTSLPNNTVVGACSVVTKSQKDSNIIIAGNPARIVKTKVLWTSEKKWN